MSEFKGEGDLSVNLGDHGENSSVNDLNLNKFKNSSVNLTKNELENSSVNLSENSFKSEFSDLNLSDFSISELENLAAKIRAKIIEVVSKNGGYYTFSSVDLGRFLAFKFENLNAVSRTKF